MAYAKTTWKDGDLISAQKMNNVENGIESLDTQNSALSAQVGTIGQQLTTLSGKVDASETAVGNLETQVDGIEESVGSINERLLPVESIAANSSETIDSDAEDVDLDITDTDGNVILRLAGGHLQTKEFNSRSIFSDASAKPSDAEGVDLDITDASGNVIARFSGGHILTKNFDSSLMRRLVGRKWAVIGDSLTEHNQRATANYHDYIADETGIEVVNLGHSGAGYAKVGGWGHNFLGAVDYVPNDVDVITIFGSGNDGSAGLPVGEITDTDNSSLCGYINQTIDAIYASFPLVPLGIITPTPWANSEPSDRTSTMMTYSEAIVNICARRGIPCLDLYHCSNLHPTDVNFRTIAYSRDEGNGVHPDENGHRFIAPRIREFLFSLIQEV